MHPEPQRPHIVAIIPARGGSKGIPQKNLRSVAGKPLIAHTIGQALAADKVQRVIVSTDDPEIESISRRYGAEVMRRPGNISDDFASSESALMHVLSELRHHEGYEPDLVVFLQCTSPIRQPMDIDQAILKLQAENADSLLSVVPSHRFIWVEANGETKPLNYDYKNRPRRQDLQPQFVENGSIYVFKPWVLESLRNRLGGKLALYVMQEDSAWDIDSLFDLEVVDKLMCSRKESEK